MSSLARFADPQVGDELVKRWPALGPGLRSEALGLLLKRPERITALLGALEQETIRPSELSAAQLNFLRTLRDPRLRERGIKVLGQASRSSRQEVIEQFLPALQMRGDSARGRVIYVERCASCHRLGVEGHALGPDLVTVKSSGKEKILVNILDPNREVPPQYFSYLVETTGGETLSGLIVSESSVSVTVRQAAGIETVVPRSNISTLQSQGQSAMPEGLEAGWSRQDLADLLECIVAAEPAGK
jgi:putative heme-binding domain-containing protein